MVFHIGVAIFKNQKPLFIRLSLSSFDTLVPISTGQSVGTIGENFTCLCTPCVCFTSWLQNHIHCAIVLSLKTRSDQKHGATNPTLTALKFVAAIFLSLFTETFSHTIGWHPSKIPLFTCNFHFLDKANRWYHWCALFYIIFR